MRAGGFLGGFFGGDNGAEMVSEKVGYFKGAIRCFIEGRRKEDEQDLHNALEKVMERVIAVYKLDQRKECKLEAKIVKMLDDMEEEARGGALEAIR